MSFIEIIFLIVFGGCCLAVDIGLIVISFILLEHLVVVLSEYCHSSHDGVEIFLNICKLLIVLIAFAWLACVVILFVIGEIKLITLTLNLS